MCLWFQYFPGESSPAVRLGVESGAGSLFKGEHPVMALDVSLEKDWKLVLPDRGFQFVGFWSCIFRTDLLVSSSRAQKPFAFFGLIATCGMGKTFSGESLLARDSMREVVKTFSRESWVVKVVL